MELMTVEPESDRARQLAPSKSAGATTAPTGLLLVAVLAQPVAVLVPRRTSAGVVDDSPAGTADTGNGNCSNDPIFRNPPNEPPSLDTPSADPGGGENGARDGLMLPANTVCGRWRSGSAASLLRAGVRPAMTGGGCAADGGVSGPGP